MEDWETAIINTIKFCGGEVSNKQIYENIGRYKVLSSEQIKETQWGGRPAYQHTIRTSLSNLVTKGLIERKSRGRYKIVDDSSIQKQNHKNQRHEETLLEYEDEKAIEGYILDSKYQKKSRNREIADKRKKLDNYTCQSCGFKMNIAGNYIIDCHHLYPFSQGDTRVTKIEDLISLCPNCHRIAHLKIPPYSVQELKRLIK